MSGSFNYTLAELDAEFDRGFTACREHILEMCEDFAGVAEEIHDEPQRKAWVSLRDCVANLQPGPLGRERKT